MSFGCKILGAFKVMELLTLNFHFELQNSTFLCFFKQRKCCFNSAEYFAANYLSETQHYYKEMMQEWQIFLGSWVIFVTCENDQSVR